MSTFILVGSKGGAGRSASGVVLATGLAAIGLRPLHLQLTLSGIRPVIALAEDVPFSTTWLPEETATPDAIRRAIEAHPECRTVVIDMTRRTVWDLALNDPRAAVLLPMRRAAHEIETAVQDYRDYFVHRTQVGASHHSRPRSICLLPITWPEELSAGDIASKIARFDPAGSKSTAPSLLMPGIPELSRDDLDDLINGSKFCCSRIINDAAINIARAATQLIR
ncbi:hypothetical protein [Tardiphaga robiniae]|uniref:ParA family protein n=1 Tax=Tardiphaga robiniae TaxID=943830 RepID=A0A7G6TU36_9BRAD|nr:hypothetical protein [Tardiphaga robiniae]QND70268.1 hypothetical protein HB776_02720 [Tardiphaga robiniae]